MTATTDLQDPDIWWNVAAGENLVRYGVLPPIERWGEHGCLKYFPYELRVFHAAVGVAWEHGRYLGIYLLKCACVLAMAAIHVLALRRALPLSGALGGAALILLATAYRTTVRGETFAHVLFPLALLAFDRVASSRTLPQTAAWCAALLGVHITWSWSHGSFPVAFAFPLAGWVGAVMDRAGRARLARITAGAATLGVTVLIHPYGLTPFAAAIEDRAIAKTLGFKEWTPTIEALFEGWREPSLMALVILLALLVLAIVSARQAPDRAWRSLVGLGFFVVGLGDIRNLPIFAASGVIWLPMLSHIDARRWRAVQALGAAGVIVTVVALAPASPWVSGRVASTRELVPTKMAPFHALDTARALGVEGRIFARITVSNWILLHENPRLRVIWSGRTTYTPECGLALARARSGDAEAFAAAHARYAFDAVLVEHVVEPDLFDMLAAQGWHLASFDLRFALFLPPEDRRSAPGGLLSATSALAYEDRAIPFVGDVLDNARARLEPLDAELAASYGKVDELLR